MSSFRRRIPTPDPQVCKLAFPASVVNTEAPRRNELRAVGGCDRTHKPQFGKRIRSIPPKHVTSASETVSRVPPFARGEPSRTDSGHALLMRFRPTGQGANVIILMTIFPSAHGGLRGRSNLRRCVGPLDFLGGPKVQRSISPPHATRGAELGRVRRHVRQAVLTQLTEDTSTLGTLGPCGKTPDRIGPVTANRD